MHLFRAMLLVVFLAATADAQLPTTRWYRGNTHTHTWNSDGDSPPDVVVRWYRERGYQFLFITDHEFITDVAPLNALLGAEGRFLVLSGQEVSQRVADSTHPDGVRQAHLNALGTTTVVRPIGERNIATAMTIAETYARNIAAIVAEGGVPQINHPNFRWSVPMEEMLTLPDGTLFELWNGHPGVYNVGGAAARSRHRPTSHHRFTVSLSLPGYLLRTRPDGPAPAGSTPEPSRPAGSPSAGAEPQSWRSSCRSPARESSAWPCASSRLR